MIGLSQSTCVEKPHYALRMIIKLPLWLPLVLNSGLCSLFVMKMT